MQYKNYVKPNHKYGFPDYTKINFVRLTVSLLYGNTICFLKILYILILPRNSHHISNSDVFHSYIQPYSVLSTPTWHIFPEIKLSFRSWSHIYVFVYQETSSLSIPKCSLLGELLFTPQTLRVRRHLVLSRCAKTANGRAAGVPLQQPDGFLKHPEVSSLDGSTVCCIWI